MSGAHDDIRRAVRDELAKNDLPEPTTGPEVGIFNLVVRVAGNMLEDARGAAADCAATAGAQVAREQATDRAAITVAEQDAMEQAAWEAVERSGWGEATAPAAVAVAVEGVIEYLRRSDFDRIDRPNLSPELVEVADLLWEQAHGAPPLDQDPVARRLGIVSEGE